MFRSCLLYSLIACSAGLDFSLHGKRVGTVSIDNSSKIHEHTLHDFVRQYQRSYVPGTEEWTKREQVFQANLNRVLKLRSSPDLSWTPGITKFMDYTESEYTRLLGYKGRRSQSARGSQAPARNEAVVQLQSTSLPPAFSVLGSNAINQIIRDQGACGSCWAEAATSVLEGVVAHNAALMSNISAVATTYHTAQATLSSQSMVSCTPNPKHCGGTGGCEGATAELAYEMVQEKGIPLAVFWPYKSGMSGKDGQCDNSLFQTQGATIGIAGYTVLPKNKFLPLKTAIVTSGAPIVVSVDATNWNFYMSGIYSDTQFGQGDFTVNHAVTLVGYAEPAPGVKGYWHIKNSWGENFGERGYIRVEMKPDEESHCGWDEDTHIGLACDGDPNRDWVCGTCGMLYDSSFPTGPYLRAPAGGLHP